VNAFADWLFNLMFGWMGTAANSAWNAVVNSTSGTGSFFSRYWLGIVLLIIIGGTVLDYAVWLVRWRPYLVWRSWLTRRLRSRRLQQTAQDLEYTDMDDHTLNTIADWVSTPQEAYPLDGLQQQGLSPLPYADMSADAGYPVEYVDPNSVPVGGYGQQGAAYPPLYPPVQPDAWQPPDLGTQDAYQPAPLWQEHTPAQYTPPADIDYSPQAAPPQPLYPDSFEADDLSLAPEPGNGWGGFTQGENLAPAPSGEGRRRRSDRSSRMRSAQRLFDGLRERLQTEDEEGMIDGLPSPVRQEDAFHEAVYPNSYRYQQPDYHGHANHNGQEQP